MNYRWTDVQAAIGLAQLEKLDRILELREAASRRYGELLEDVDGVEVPSAGDADHKRSWFVYVVKLDAGLDRAAVMDALRREESRRPSTCRASICSRTCASGTGLRRAFALSPRTLRAERSPCRSSRRSTRPTSTVSSRC